MASEYAELRQIIRDKGLLKKQIGYYTWKAITTLCMLIGSGLFMVLINETWAILAGAVLLAFTFGQTAFIGHDIGHKQIFKSETANIAAGFLVDLLLGVSRTGWTDKHDAHHANPNDPDLDPDVNIPVLAFSKEQVLGRNEFIRFIIPLQAYYFLPLLSLVSISLRVSGVAYLLKSLRKKFTALVLMELVVVALHFLVYGLLVFYFCGFFLGIFFVLVHQIFFGMYMGSVFAPNHKGMPLISKDSGLDTLRVQVLTSRNIKPNAVRTFLLGGLDYQIEHHLFPEMARNKLGEAKEIVEAFCKEKGVYYHETGFLRNWREIFSHLNAVAKPL